MFNVLKRTCIRDNAFAIMFPLSCLYLMKGVIIFGSVRFLPIKPTKLKFFKIQKLKSKPIQTDQFQFGYFILKIKTQPTDFGSVWFQFGYFILKTKKLYCFLGFFWTF